MMANRLWVILCGLVFGTACAAEVDVTPAEPAPNVPGASASTCTPWMIDDFDGGATLETLWMASTLDGATPPSVIEPVPVAAGASGNALRVAMALPQPTSLEVLTHFHGLDPLAYDALTFRARTATPTAAAMAVAVTGEEAQGLADAVTVTLTSEWQWHTISMDDLARTGEDFDATFTSVYRFTVLDSPEIDVWLDDVEMVCAR